MNELPDKKLTGDPQDFLAQTIDPISGFFSTILPILADMMVILFWISSIQILVCAS